MVESTKHDNERQLIDTHGRRRRYNWLAGMVGQLLGERAAANAKIDRLEARLAAQEAAAAGSRGGGRAGGVGSAGAGVGAGARFGGGPAGVRRRGAQRELQRPGWDPEGGAEELAEKEELEPILPVVRRRVAAVDRTPAAELFRAYPAASSIVNRVRGAECSIPVLNPGRVASSNHSALVQHADPGPTIMLSGSNYSVLNRL